MKGIPVTTCCCVSLLCATASSFSGSDGGRSPLYRPNRPATTTITTTAPLRQAVQVPPRSSRRRPPNRRKVKKRAVNRTPLVDSTLLRFLSKPHQTGSNKFIKRKEATRTSVQTSEASGASFSTERGPPLTTAAIERKEMRISELDSRTKAADSQSDEASRQQSTRPASSEQLVRSLTWGLTADYDAAILDADLANAAVSAWLRQYQRSNVANALQSRGPLDDVTAQAAAESVESVALARIARRRVRSFLKERDQVWSGSSGGGASRETTEASGLSVQQPGISQTSMSPSSVDEAPSLMTAYDQSTDSVGGTNYDSLERVVDLLLENGVTVRDIAEIFVHSPGIAFMRPKPAEINESTSRQGETLQETLDRVFSGLLMGQYDGALKLRKYDARKVLRNTPGLLTMRGSKAATDMVALLSRLGVSSNSIARDKNALPTLLSRSPSAVFRLVAFLSSDAVRMPVDNIGPLLRRAGCKMLLNAVAPVRSPEKEVSEGSASIVVTDDEEWSAQLRREQVNDVYLGMSTTAWTLRHEIGTADLGKVVAAYPSVLLLDAKRQILPVAHYLMDELGIWKDDLPRVLQLYPSLLAMDLETTKGVVSYLESLDVARENMASIFRSFPALLTLDVDTQMVPVVDFLKSIGIVNLGRFITRLPPVLGYSVDDELRPKWQFLRTVCTDPRFEVSRFPAYFSYPLERVIKTRFEYLRDEKGIPTPLLSLDQVLCYGDRDFATKIARDADLGASFGQYAEQRKRDRAAGGNKTKQRRRNKQATTAL